MIKFFLMVAVIFSVSACKPGNGEVEDDFMKKAGFLKKLEYENKVDYEIKIQDPKESMDNSGTITQEYRVLIDVDIKEEITCDALRILRRGCGLWLKELGEKKSKQKLGDGMLAMTRSYYIVPKGYRVYFTGSVIYKKIESEWNYIYSGIEPDPNEMLVFKK